MAAPDMTLRRRKRMAGLQRPRAASTAHDDDRVLGGYLCARASCGSYCAPPACDNSEMECPDLFQCCLTCVCLPNVRVASIMRVCLPKRSVASVSFLYTAQACLHIPALTHCVGVFAMAALHSWDVAHDYAEMPDPGWGIGSPTAQRVHDRGGGRPRARGRLVFEGQAHDQLVFDCSLRFKDDA